MQSVCPQCGFKDNSSSRLQAEDGGSNVCKKCQVLWHRCSEWKNGIETKVIRYGSPGPSLCPKCSDYPAQEKHNSDPKPNPLECPQCGHENDLLENLYDGKGEECLYCGHRWHPGTEHTKQKEHADVDIKLGPMRCPHCIAYITSDVMVKTVSCGRCHSKCGLIGGRIRVL